jgi:integrase
VIAELRAERKRIPNASGLLFTIDGQPIPKNLFEYWFRTACKKAGIKNFRFHDLRHYGDFTVGGGKHSHGGGDAGSRSQVRREPEILEISESRTQKRLPNFVPKLSRRESARERKSGNCLNKMASPTGFEPVLSA